MTRRCVDFFHKKYSCEVDGEKFSSEEDLMNHYKTVHHKLILKCHKCGKELKGEDASPYRHQVVILLV